MDYTTLRNNPLVIIHENERTNIFDFCRRHNLKVHIYERGKGYRPGEQFYAHFGPETEIKKGIFVGAYPGNGRSHLEAIKNLCLEVSKKVLVVRRPGQDECLINVPMLFMKEDSDECQ